MWDGSVERKCGGCAMKVRDDVEQHQRRAMRNATSGMLDGLQQATFDSVGVAQVHA